MSSVITNKTPEQGDVEELDLGRLLGELIDHRKLIISITAFFTAIAILYALFATPIYQANALIQVEQKQGNAILDSLNQMLPDSQPQSAPEISLLQSRMIIGKTIDDLNLQARVAEKYFPFFGRGLARMMGDAPGQLSVTRLYLPTNGDDGATITLTVKDKTHYRVNGENIELNGETGVLLNDKGIALMVNAIDAAPGTRFTLTYVSRLKAITDLQKDFNVTDQGKDTGMLNLTLSGDNPTLITAILNSISDNYLAQNVARQAAQDAKSLDFLNQQLPKVRADLDAAEDRLNAYRKKKDSVDLSMEAKSVLDQIVNVDNQLNELTFREAEVSQFYKKDHPTYRALLEKRDTLQNEKKKLNSRVSAMPSTQQEVLRLSRDVESGRAVYLQLLNRQQELNIAKSSAIGNVRIIDNAIALPNPIKPKKALTIVLGMMLGAFISIGVVLLRVFLRRGIESPEQLEELGINVYASVPISEWLAKRTSKQKKNIADVLLAVENPADLAIEAIRGLRTSLHFAMMEAKNNVLMISGASPTAGKTFISSNLATVIARTGKKVLFIDADMRKGYAHKLFGQHKGEGLSAILSGQCDLQQTIVSVEQGGFDYIARGQIPPNPAELLMHRRLEELLNKVSAQYDLVIVDTPPILAVTDAAIIGRYAGTVMMVARFELNTAKEIAVSIKRFEQGGIAVKGCILNGIVKKASSYYGYGYSYGYSAYGDAYSAKK